MAYTELNLRERSAIHVVFTSDHGDYLGDHWLGEKELFHDASVRMPMIVVRCSPFPGQDLQGRAAFVSTSSISFVGKISRQQIRAYFSVQFAGTTSNNPKTFLMSIRCSLVHPS
jgi:hypothetical protein